MPDLAEFLADKMNVFLAHVVIIRIGVRICLRWMLPTWLFAWTYPTIFIEKETWICSILEYSTSMVIPNLGTFKLKINHTVGRAQIYVFQNTWLPSYSQFNENTIRNKEMLNSLPSLLKCWQACNGILSEESRTFHWQLSLPSLWISHDSNYIDVVLDMKDRIFHQNLIEAYQVILSNIFSSHKGKLICSQYTYFIKGKNNETCIIFYASFRILN